MLNYKTAARYDIKWIKDFGKDDIDSINWLKNPLLELSEEELWQELEGAYNG